LNSAGPGWNDASVEQRPSREQASDAVGWLGWRYLLGTLCTCISVASLPHAAEVAASVVAACGDEADQHLRVDIRPRLVLVTLQSADEAGVSARDVELAGLISQAVRAAGLRTQPGTGPEGPRPVQMLEIAIDAMSIAAIRPFWRVVLGYGDDPGGGGPEDAITDPAGQGPAVWFQQMDRPRPQRNRVHLDITVAHDEAARRIEAALAAGGRLVSADHAPKFWVLADAEGNEACVSTWQGRD
jgi:4a-hydroxytetrahydrobiopterin dehydratase